MGYLWKKRTLPKRSRPESESRSRLGSKSKLSRRREHASKSGSASPTLESKAARRRGKSVEKKLRSGIGKLPKSSKRKSRRRLRLSEKLTRNRWRPTGRRLRRRRRNGRLTWRFLEPRTSWKKLRAWPRI